MDPKLQFIRAQQGHPDAAERTALNLMAHTLRTWNEATGALERLDIDPLPHQITLVHRILSSGNTNWLIADDVGLGKTIEVGLLLGALSRRQNLRRILVIVPSGLTRQWKDEMLLKFDRRFRIFGSDFNIGSPDEWGMYDQVIASMDLVKPRDRDDLGQDPDTRFGSLAQAGKWDIVIVDEAHRLSREDSSHSTLRYDLGRMLRQQTDSMILLSGTPHQGDVARFQNILRLVRPDLEASIAAIDEDPSFLRDVVLRNRKIDVVDASENFIFHGLVVRRTEIQPQEPVVELERLLSNYLSQGYRAGSTIGGAEGRAIGFVMTTYRKLASSSVFALGRAMVRRRRRLLGQAVVDAPEHEEDAGDTDDADETTAMSAADQARQFFEQELASIDAIIRQAQLCFAADSKVAELTKAVDELVMRQHQKLLIFTEYRSTQQYLARHIERLLGYPPALIRGGMSVDDKQAAIQAFDSDVAVLISTEAGGEGLNLHRHCHVMVNYDLPWNPARLTQRIGRLYRYGQKERVVVINFVSRETIDNDILASVLARLDAVISQMTPVSDEFGDNYSADILGEVLERLDISDLLDEAKTGKVHRSDERINEAIERARNAKKLQDDILAAAAGGDASGWRRLGPFTTADVARFICRSCRKLGIAVTESADAERFDLVLPESLRGCFPEFGRRTRVEARTLRGQEITDQRVLLDFSSSFVRYLVEQVTDEGFGGGYGVSIGAEGGNAVCAAMLARYQNEQGEPRGLELMAARQMEDQSVEIDNSCLRPLFAAEQATGTPSELSADRRKNLIDAIFDRVEAEVGANCGPYRHTNSMFPIGIIEARQT